jgi:hypothetical protein
MDPRLASLIFLMLVYPLLAMLWYHEYPVFSAEVGILLAAATAVALMLSWLLRQTRPLVSNLVIVGGLTIVSLIQFNLFFPGMVVVFAVGIVLALVFGRKFQALVPIVLVAMVIGAWLDNFVNPATRMQELAPTEVAAENGPVIHLLMDGFIGPDGLPTDTESQLLRSQIVSFFKDYDFHLNTRAYSHYTTTVDSMTHVLNFRNDDESIFQRSALLREVISFRENAWFTALDQSGYQVVVYQTESMNFCEPHLTRKIICNVFPIPNLKTLHQDLKNPLIRAAVLLRTMASQSMIVTKTLRDARIMGTWGVSVYDERMMKRLSRDVQIQPGNAYFAHVLVPHAPAVFREDCSIDYDSEPWTRWPNSAGVIKNSSELRAVRYTRIIPQIKCALTLLGELFDSLKASGLFDRSTIIVHGDHGTSAFQVRPSAYTMDQLDYRDLKESFSILFAVKLPGEIFRVDEEVNSLSMLMARTAAVVTGKSADELGSVMTSEEEPFVYLLTEVAPLRRAYINIFGPPSDKDREEEP